MKYRNDLASYFAYILSRLERSKVKIPNAIPLPMANISSSSDKWNRLALQYAESRRSLNGRLRTFQPVVHFPPGYFENMQNVKSPIAVNVSDSTNTWNRLALEYARNRKRN